VAPIHHSQRRLRFDLDNAFQYVSLMPFMFYFCQARSFGPRSRAKAAGDSSMAASRASACRVYLLMP
jgi:hypothetical protein